MNAHPEVSRRLSLAELLDHGGPQTPNLVGILDGGVNHDQFRGWIDADALAVGADERELAPRSRKQPQEIAIAEIRHGLARCEIDVGGTHARRLDQPLLWTEPHGCLSPGRCLRGKGPQGREADGY